jgi:hypothetical protein
MGFQQRCGKFHPCGLRQWTNEPPLLFLYLWFQTQTTGPRLPCAISEWTDRWDPRIGKLLSAAITIECKKLDIEFKLGCRSVSNHSDNVLVSIKPNKRTGQLHISQHRGRFAEEIQVNNNSGPCLQFTVAVPVSGLLASTSAWQCQGPDGQRGDVRFHPCDSAANCANVLRTVKKMVRK